MAKYKKALISIPDVTGDIKISVSSAIDRYPVLYNGKAEYFNIKYNYETKCYEDAPGRYITELIPLDLTKKAYVNVSGLGDASHGDVVNGWLNKMIFYKNGVAISCLHYDSNYSPEGKLQNSFSVSKLPSNIDAIRFEIIPKGVDVLITEADVFPTSKVSIVLSDEPLF